MTHESRFATVAAKEACVLSERSRFVLLAIVALSIGLGALGCKSGGKKAEACALPTAASSQSTATQTETPEAADLPFGCFHYVIDIDFSISQPGQPEQSGISGTIEGDYVSPDSHSFTNRFAVSGLAGTQDVIIIGPDAWIREGQGDWVATTADDPDVIDTITLTTVDPGFPAAGDFASDISTLDSEPDTVNSVETRRYAISNEAVQALKDLLGDSFLPDSSGIRDFEMTVWLEQESNGLVRAELTGTADRSIFGGQTGLTIPDDATVGFSMTINLTRLNDTSISIEPPI